MGEAGLHSQGWESEVLAGLRAGENSTYFPFVGF